MTFLGKFKGSYQDLWKAIIRPPRDEYAIKDLGKSPTSSKILTSIRPSRIQTQGKDLQKN